MRIGKYIKKDLGIWHGGEIKEDIAGVEETFNGFIINCFNKGKDVEHTVCFTLEEMELIVGAYNEAQRLNDLERD